MLMAFAQRSRLWMIILNFMINLVFSAQSPQNVAINPAMSNANQVNTSDYSTSNKNLTVQSGSIECNSARFGLNLPRQSCIGALHSLPADNVLRTLGQRDKGTFNVPLPRRYLSADGLCAIDIMNIKIPPFRGSATNKEIFDGAQMLVNQCVVRGSRRQEYAPVGGIIRHLGV